MKYLAGLLAALVTSMPLGLAAQSTGFDGMTVGTAPAGWILTVTGKGNPRWMVMSDDTAPTPPNVLEQSGVADFPITVTRDSSIRDGFVEVKLKPISGREDQAGGVVWRFQDANNYYICRANALENNVVLYRVHKGKRESIRPIGRWLAYGVKHPVPVGRWHTLRVEFQAARAKVLFNGQVLFETEDKTFTQPGGVGVWTKADSVIRFDDFAYGGR